MTPHNANKTSTTNKTDQPRNTNKQKQKRANNNTHEQMDRAHRAT